MKVHVYGNTLNAAYNMTQFLRANGVAAEMFLDNTSSSRQDYPWWEDRSLSETSLPPWIHYHRTKPFYPRPSARLRQMIRDFSQCDIALVSGLGPILAMKARVPFVFYSMGSDLNIINLRLEAQTLLRSRLPLRARAARVASLIAHAPLQRLALRRYAGRILVLMGYQVNPFIVRHGLREKTTKCRVAWDTSKYAARSPDEALMARYESHDIVFFMVARHSWTSVWEDTKGNDKFLRAYARFAKQTKCKVLLVTIAKGTDLAASRKLVDQLGIGAAVEWVPEMNKDGIRAFESLPNCVVVDQFWHNEWYRKFPEDRSRPVIGLGFGGIEALSAGRPLLTAFSDEAFYEGGSPPILSAFTEEEIFARLMEVSQMTAEGRQRMGEAGRAFVHRWHDWHNVTPLYIDALKEVLARSRGASSSAVPHYPSSHDRVSSVTK